ncbi:MAG: energy-coupling factor transporter transmembrane protein EcfT [Cyanobacteria bacterium P01_H01_bin.15]
MDLLRSLPLGLYLEKPVTWLHHLDPRVKLGWLLSFLMSPLLASDWWRIGLVVVLLAISISAGIPWRALRQQIGWLLIVCTLIFVMTCVLPDGMGIQYQPRLPDTPELIARPGGYRYILFEYSRFQVTQRSLDLAIRLSTLLFTLLYSSSLYLLTTAPEEITAGLEDLSLPLRKLGLPITEIALTLTLSLRFIPLVMEEVQNLGRSIQTRGINWSKLGLKGGAQIWIVVTERLFQNLLLRAEQIAMAMETRGFTTPDTHRVLWHQLRLRWFDGLAIALVLGFWWARVRYGHMG